MSYEPSDAAVVNALADDLPIAIWVWRAPAGEFVYANRLAVDLLGAAPRTDVVIADAPGPYHLHTPDGRPYPADRLPSACALRTGATVTADDIVIHRNDGRRIAVRATARLVRGAAGTPTHVVVTFTDVSDQVARGELAARLHRIELLASIGHLAGGIAHDFNNLLASIKMLVHRLRRGESDPTRLADIDDIEEATINGIELMQALLDFAGRPPRNATRVPLHEVLGALGRALRRNSDNPDGDNRLVITTELRSAAGEVQGERAQLEQALAHLLVHARDAMPAGGRLTVRSYDHTVDAREAELQPPLRRGPHVVIEVCDTGARIPPALRERLFEPYLPGAVPRRVRSGLGPAAAYGIVVAHGGSIAALDDPAGGNMMRVYLPAAPAAPAPERTTAPGSRRLILLVDDEPLVRRATAAVLTDLGYDVALADGGAAAIEIFRARSGDIAAVLLDARMPDMDGRATWLALRAVDLTVPVILITGNPGDDDARELLALGVRACLPKPCDLDLLSATLTRVIDAA